MSKTKIWINKLSAKENIEKANIPFKREIGISLLVNLTMIFSIFLFLKSLPPQIPLFYGLAEGEEQLVSSWALILPNLISLLIIILNSIIASLLQDEFTKNILIIASISSTFFATTTVLKVFFLVGAF